jgi:hypothetical protein
MTRKNPRYELPEEVLAVLECSPNLEPCEKFRYADIYAFAKHLNARKCQQCIAWSADGQRTKNNCAVVTIQEPLCSMKSLEDSFFSA